MRITNKHGLPLNMELFKPKEPNQKTLSVTRMIDSPLIQWLTLQNWDKLEQDVSDMLYMMEGEAVHSIMEKHAEEGSIVEENMSLMVGDTMVTARADKYVPIYGHSKTPTDEEIHYLIGGEVVDWKGTSVWTYIRALKENGTGAKSEWVKQLNIYAFLFRRLGKPVTQLTVWLKLRDWTPSEKARSGPEYPACGFAKCEIPLWNDAEAQRYIIERIQAHKVCVESKGQYVCTDEERWIRPTTWAVMKKGRKTAVAVFGPGQTRGGGKKEAEDYMLSQPGTCALEERVGGYIRCELYCPVRTICPVLAGEASGRGAPTLAEPDGTEPPF